MYTWNFQIIKQLDNNEITNKLSPLALECFGKTFRIEHFQNKLNQATLLSLLMKDKKIVGFVIHSIPEIPLKGAYMLWVNAICLAKSVRSKGYFSKHFDDIFNFFPDKRFGYIACKTQSPIVLKKYAEMGMLFPFESSYTGKEGKRILDYLCKHVDEFKEIKKFDWNNGVCRRVYNGSLTDRSIKKIKSIERFEEQLLNWNFNRHAGDSIIIVSKLGSPAK